MDGLGVLLDLRSIDLRLDIVEDEWEEVMEVVSAFMVDLSEYILVGSCCCSEVWWLR